MGRVGISKHGRGNSKLLAYNQKPQPKLGQYGQALRRGLRQLLQPCIRIKIGIATKFIIEIVIQIHNKQNYIYIYIYKDCYYLLRLLLKYLYSNPYQNHIKITIKFLLKSLLRTLFKSLLKHNFYFEFASTLH